jgi:hypothetical protein
MGQEFLDLLGGDVMLCVMPPDGGPPSALRGPDALTQALARNASLNAYFAVNVVKQGVNKKPTKAEIETIRAIGGDIDWNRKKFNGRFGEGMQELGNTVLKALIKTIPQPTLITFTGGGLQPLWLIEPLPNTTENRNRAEDVGEHIAARFGGDPVGNIDRILRLPSSINHPKKDKRDAGQPTERAGFRIVSNQRYRLEELEAAWSSLPRDIRGRDRKRPVQLPSGSLNDDLGGGMKERDAGEALLTCKEIGPLIASVPNGPLSVRSKWRNPLTGEDTGFGWRDWLYVMSGIADDDPSLEEQCKQLFDEVSEKAGGETSQNDAQWRSQAGRKARRTAAGDDVTTVGTLVRMWEMVEPLAPTPPSPPQAAGWQTTSLHPPDHRPDQLGLETISDLSLKPPPRAWAYGIWAMYGEVTLLGGPSSFGKTALGVVISLACASGRSLLGHKVFLGPQKTLHISSEEPTRELWRRYLAAALHHQVIQAHIGNVTFRGNDANSGKPIELMQMTSKGVAAVNPDGIALLERLIDECGARVVLLDPLYSFLAGGLNDNSAMGLLVHRLIAVAQAKEVAIIVMHHPSKGKDPESNEAFMGASTIVFAVRSAITIVRASAEEMIAIGAPPNAGLFRIFHGKPSYSKPQDEEQWFWQRSVNLGNATPEYPNGDSVGVVETYDTTVRVGVDPVQARIMLRVIANPPFGIPLSPTTQSRQNYRKPVRTALRQAGVPMPQKGDDAKRMVDALLDALIVGGLVREEQVTSSGRNKVKGLVITEAGRKWLDGEDVAPKSDATPESATAEGATPERDVTQESKITPESNLTAGAFRDSSGGKRGPSNSLVKPPSKG